MFVCPAVMTDPGQTNTAFHCAVPQSWGMFPCTHVLKSSKHEHKSNNLRKESANCGCHLYIHSMSVCSLRSLLCFLVCVCVMWLVT